MPEPADILNTTAELPPREELEPLLLEVNSTDATLSARDYVLHQAPGLLNAHGFANLFKEMFSRILPSQLEQWTFNTACAQARNLVERFAAAICPHEQVLAWALELAGPGMPADWHHDSAYSDLNVPSSDALRVALREVEVEQSPWCEQAVATALARAGDSLNFVGHANLLLAMLSDYEKEMERFLFNRYTRRAGARAYIRQCAYYTCPEPLARAMALREVDRALGWSPGS